MGAKMFSPAVKKWCPEFQPILGEIEMSPKSVCDCSTFRLPALAAGVLGMGLHYAAYFAEVYRGGIEAVPRGQWSAGASLGMTFGQQLRYIVWPQALKIAVAPTVGFLVQVVKSTALASIIGFTELTKTGTMITNAAFRPFPIYGMVAMIYFAMCFPLTWYARVLEKRQKVGQHR